MLPGGEIHKLCIKNKKIWLLYSCARTGCLFLSNKRKEELEIKPNIFPSLNLDTVMDRRTFAHLQTAEKYEYDLLT